MSSHWDHIERLEYKVKALIGKVRKIEKSLDRQIVNAWDHELYAVNEDLKLADQIDALVKVTRKNQDILEELIRQQKAEGGEK